MDQDATWQEDRPQPRRHYVRWGPNFHQKGNTAAPHFSAHFFCGHMAGWIKIPLGTEVGLGPGHIVLDGDTADPPKRGHSSPQFSAHVYCGQTVADLSNS